MTDPPMYNIASYVTCHSLAIVWSLSLPGCDYGLFSPGKYGQGCKYGQIAYNSHVQEHRSLTKKKMFYFSFQKCPFGSSTPVYLLIMTLCNADPPVDNPCIIQIL